MLYADADQGGVEHRADQCKQDKGIVPAAGADDAGAHPEAQACEESTDAEERPGDGVEDPAAIIHLDELGEGMRSLKSVILAMTVTT